MPLKIRMRPGERIVVNGVVLRNRGPRGAELEVLNRGVLLHERDLMLPEQTNSPLHELYFLLQAMHLEDGDFESAYRQALAITSRIVIAAMAENDGATVDLATEIVRFIGTRDYIGGMRRLQKLIGRPGDARGVLDDEKDDQASSGGWSS